VLVTAGLVGGRPGGLVLARWEAPSSLAYSELVVVRGRAPRGWRVEALHVDLEASVRGGRELFGVPKALASFAWGDREAEVRGPGGELVAHVAWSAPRARLPLPALGAVLGAGRRFRVGGLLRVGPVRARVQAPLPAGASAPALLALAGHADVRAGAIRDR
jgi:hypothetical protein